MSKPMPDHQFLNGNFAPWPMEGEIHDLPVEGEIPRELEGTYYRNGSNPQYAPGPSYHWFDGDGMVHAFQFENGRCHYRNRFVKTARFELEREAGKGLFAGLGVTDTPDPRIQGVSPNTSNTNVVMHGGKLLSLWEGGPPHELDPATLDTIGIHDYDGAFYRERAGQQMHDIMTAHPKPDPDTGEFIGFGYSPLPPHLVYHVVDAAGKLTRSEEIEVPYPSMMHDFITTAEHAIFPVFPCVFDFENIAKTGSPLDWQPERGSHIGVLPRNGKSDDCVWVPHEPCMVFHPVNAYCEDGNVVAHVWQFPKLHLFPVEGGEKHIPGTLYRWTIDLTKRELVADRLDDAPADFGRIDQRRMGKSYRHIFSVGSLVPGSIGEPESFDCLFHYDLASDKRREHRLAGKGDSTGEPVFVPRTPDSDEGDGFVLAVVHRAEGNHSEMLVLDAQNVDAAPLATIGLPHAIPFGFHGNWRPATA